MNTSEYFAQLANQSLSDQTEVTGEANAAAEPLGAYKFIVDTESNYSIL